MSDLRLVPAYVEAVLEKLDVPLDERFLPLQRVLNTGHILEIRVAQGRHYLCAFLNESAIEPDDRLLESLLEEAFQSRASGFLAYESADQRLIYWSEILPAAEPGGAPRPDLLVFLREVTELSKKVSLAGGL
jgi:hypothetical protein